MVLFLPFNFEPKIAFFVKMKCNISFKETPNQKKCQNIIEIIPQHLFVIFDDQHKQFECLLRSTK